MTKTRKHNKTNVKNNTLKNKILKDEKEAEAVVLKNNNSYCNIGLKPFEFEFLKKKTN